MKGTITFASCCLPQVPGPTCDCDHSCRDRYSCACLDSPCLHSAHLKGQLGICFLYQVAPGHSRIGELMPLMAIHNQRERASVSNSCSTSSRQKFQKISIPILRGLLGTKFPESTVVDLFIYLYFDLCVFTDSFFLLQTLGVWHQRPITLLYSSH